MIEQLKKQIEEAEHVVLLGHLYPDGDAVGATLAMCGVIEAMGKVATVIYPNDFPPYLSWLNGAEHALIFSREPERVKNVLSRADFMIMLDFNDASRLDELQHCLPNLPFAVIDHHPSPAFDTPLLFSNTEVSSTCELLTNLLYQMNMEVYIDQNAATALFVGILTDTGRFSHNSSRPQTYRIVANLLEKGVEKDVVIDRVFDSFSEGRMRLMGYVLNDKMEVFPEKGLSIIALSSEEKKRFNFQSGDAEGLVNMPLSIVEVNCSVFMQEHENLIRMSFRSKGDFQVNKIAAEHFDGGGHPNAAGGTSHLSLEATLTRVKEILL